MIFQWKSKVSRFEVCYSSRVPSRATGKWLRGYLWYYQNRSDHLPPSPPPPQQYKLRLGLHLRSHKSLLFWSLLRVNNVTQTPLLVFHLTRIINNAIVLNAMFYNKDWTVSVGQWHFNLKACEFYKHKIED